jgi:GNAT superfamily N-acetyltransferase
VVGWVRGLFGDGWADECDLSFTRRPASCFIATVANRVIGMCTYDGVARGVAGPMGVEPKFQGRGVGKAVFVEALLDMRDQGYQYAILGWTRPEVQALFQKLAGATVIEGSAPRAGMYRGLLVKE